MTSSHYQLSLFEPPPPVEPLSLFEPPPVEPPPVEPPPPPVEPPPPPSRPNFQEVEQRCQAWIMQGNRQALIDYLNQLCITGNDQWVGRLCQLRNDFGLKVRNQRVVEFFQLGDSIQIYKQGQFYGKAAQIISLENGVATVKAENWVIEHSYSVGEIRLFQRKKEQ